MRNRRLLRIAIAVVVGVVVGLAPLPVVPPAAAEYQPSLETRDLGALVEDVPVERREAESAPSAVPPAAEEQVVVTEAGTEDTYSVVFEAPVRFEMIGFTGDSTADLPGHSRVRTSLDGSTWGPWYEVEFESADGPDAAKDVGVTSKARPGSPPIYTGTAQWVELESAGDSRSLTVSFLDLDGSSLSAPEKILHYLSRIFTSPPGPQADALPTIITRPQWGADESWRKSDPSYGQVKIAIVHHTEGSNDYSASQSAAIVRGIYEYHVFSRGWSDIGYNFLVDKYGQIFEGRYGGVEKSVIGAHAGGFNTYSTGVSVMGSHISVEPSAAAMAALEEIVLWKLSIHTVWPLGQTWIESQGSTRWPAGTPVLMRNVSGHRDASATDCPGARLYDRIPGLAQRIAARWPIALPKPPPLAVNPQPPYWEGWRIARQVVADPASDGGVTLDGWGGLHNWGGAAVSFAGSTYWPRWDIARGLAVTPGGPGGVTLDAWGGLHRWGGNNVSLTGAPYWYGWDIARAVALNPSGPGGWVLDGWAGVHAFGGAPNLDLAGAPYWYGWDMARSLVLNPSGSGGWILDAWGGVHEFGGAPDVTGNPYWIGGEYAKSMIAPKPAWGGSAGYTADAWGGVHAWT